VIKLISHMHEYNHAGTYKHTRVTLAKATIHDNHLYREYMHA